MSALNDGLYMIASQSADCQIGRYYIEDLSLLPKRITVLRQNMGPAARPWIIQKSGEGYRLKANGAPVGERDGLLWAHLIMEEQANEWLITPVPQMGERAYIIEKTDHSAGWAVNDDDEASPQVAVRPLISTKSLPPQYPKNQVFIITPAGDE